MKKTNFYQILQQHAQTIPRKPALVSPGQIITYGELFKVVSATGRYLAEKGIDEQSVVGISVNDEIFHTIISLALLSTGCNQITLASYNSETFRKDLADRVSLTDLIVSERDFSLTSCRTILWSSLNSEADVFTKDLLNNNPRSGSIFFYTSGTTSEPNIVKFSEEDLINQAGNCREYANENILRLASIEHNNSKRHRLYSLSQGGTSTFKSRDNDLLQYCHENKVTCLEMSRMHAVNLLKHDVDSFKNYLASVKLRIAGSAVPASLRLELQESVCPNLFVRYAATESGLISMAGPGQHETESVGIPGNGVTVEIVDPDMNKLEPGNIGEVRVKTPGMATGYWDNRDQTAEKFRDGWFHPGDMGEFLENGLLKIHGRKDDMLIMNSLNIFPAQIEKALDQHPMVKESAACGIESAVHGQIPVAVVVLFKNAVIDETSLQRYARERLSLRAPRKIKIIESIPRNPQNKVLRKEISKLFKRDTE